MNILVTGGAGYIGSHTCVVLLQAGHDVTVIDNLCNSSPIALERVQELAGRQLRFVQGDIRSRDDLGLAFEGGIDAVIHFAALKAVGESCEQPLAYFDNNIGGTITLMQAMQAHGVERLVFSSSATVYGEPDSVPVREDAPLRVTNPYGRTKLVMEQLIADWCRARARASAVLLRYFNPVGAHPSGRIGEDPRGVPNNLMPYVAQVAVGRRERLSVFGSDYPTPDGTGVRDYLHVMDLAEAHQKAVNFAAARTGCEVFNLGTGRGYSVLEVVRAFEMASGLALSLDMVGRRAGDVAELTADPGKAQEGLNWIAQYGIDAMCAHAWRWQSDNPKGFEGRGLESRTGGQEGMSATVGVEGRESAYVQLVPYDRDCLDKSWEWLNDPEIRALTMTPEFSRDDQLAFFNTLPTRSGYHIWGISHEGRVVGAAGLKNVRDELAEYWGYIGQRELWGRGLGKSLMMQVESEAKKLGFRKLDLRVSAANPRAISLYRTMGYVPDESSPNVSVIRMNKSLP